MKVKEITLKEAVKVTNVDVSTGNVTYKDDVTGVMTTVPKGMATPTAQGQVNISAQQVAPGQAGAAPAPTIKVGDNVDVIGQTGHTQQTSFEELESNVTQPGQPEDDQQLESSNDLPDVNDLYSEWLNSEYAPYDDDAGNYNKVFDQALMFVGDIVGPDYAEMYAEKLANLYHGEEGSIDEVAAQLASIKKLSGL